MSSECPSHSPGDLCAYFSMPSQIDSSPPPFFFRVLMVLGAGRGPLVNASLRAAKQADRRIKLYAVEKNPNAVVT